MPRNPRRLFRLFAALACAAAPAAGANALSLTGNYTTGSQYRGYEARTGLDFGADKEWGLNASYAQSHSTHDGESRTRQVTAGLSHDMDDNWSSRVDLIGWRDFINAVEYAGPSASFAYTALGDERGGGDELFRTSFNADLFAMRADETTAPKTVVVKRKATVLPPQEGNVTLAQWHPSFEVEKPFWKGSVIPRLSFGHFFYSKNPTLIEARAGRPRFASSAGSINGLVGGTPKNDAKAGITFLLPGHIDLDGSLGVQQLATDNTWAATQAVSLSQKYMKRLRVEAAWSRTIQSGQVQDLYTGGLSLTF